jgi:hypothetical protein
MWEWRSVTAGVRLATPLGTSCKMSSKKVHALGPSRIHYSIRQDFFMANNLKPHNTQRQPLTMAQSQVL